MFAYVRLRANALTQYNTTKHYIVNQSFQYAYCKQIVFKKSGVECHLTLREIIGHTQGNLRLVW